MSEGTLPWVVVASGQDAMAESAATVKAEAEVKKAEDDEEEEEAVPDAVNALKTTDSSAAGEVCCVAAWLFVCV